MKVLSIFSLVAAVAVTPTEKVIQMLEDMSAKGKSRMEEEQIAFAKFSTFCENESGVLKREIKEGKSLMESLQADILKAKTDAEDLAADIAQLNKDIDTYNTEIADQKKERADTNKEFIATEKDLSESVDALARAISILKRQNFDRKQAASFLQTDTSIPTRAKALIADFLAMEDSDDFLDRKAPEANAYEFQSGGIIDMLKKLEIDFKTQLSDAQTAEMNSKHAYEMAMQDLTASVAASEESVGKKTAMRQKRLSFQAKQEKELSITTASYEEDKKTLSDLTTECEEKTHSYKEKQQLSADELDALSEAIKILSGDSVSGAAAEHLPGLIQKKTSLLQINTEGLNKRKERHAVLDFLSEQAKKLKSDKLSLLAQKIASDPFLKVKKMIKAMVTKLMKQQNEEAELKGFCDKELGTSKITRDRLNQEMDALKADYDEASATAAKLGELIVQLTEEVAAIDVAVKESTEVRSAEKEKNTQTIADAKAAQEAVAQATNVLKSFYEKAGQATAFIQVPNMGSDEWKALANPNYEGTGAGYGQGSEDKVDKGHKEGMQTFGDTYQGQQDSANGVMAMLEVIMSDFANLETETKTQEEESQQMYERFMADSKKDKSVKSKQIEMNTADKKEAEHNAAQAKRDLSTTDDELLAAERYYENLKPKCVDEGVSQEERDAKRQEEIDSLKEALEMLKPQDF